MHLTEECCAQALASGTPVSLFLRDISVIDQAGREMLERLVRKGVRLLASGLYTSHLVQSLQRSGKACTPSGLGPEKGRSG